MRVKQVLVFMIEKSRRATPIAPDIVKRMKRYMVGSDNQPEARVRIDRTVHRRSVGHLPKPKAKKRSSKTQAATG